MRMYVDEDAEEFDIFLEYAIKKYKYFKFIDFCYDPKTERTIVKQELTNRQGFINIEKFQKRCDEVLSILKDDFIEIKQEKTYYGLKNIKYLRYYRMSKKFLKAAKLLRFFEDPFAVLSISSIFEDFRFYDDLNKDLLHTISHEYDFYYSEDAKEFIDKKKQELR